MAIVPHYDSLLDAIRESDVSGGGSTPGGSDTNIQFNDASTFAGDSTLTFNKTTKTLGAQTAVFTEANGRQEVINTALSAPAVDVDPGAYQNNSLAGITSKYITGKTLHNVAIGGSNGTPISGSIRQTVNTIQFYLNGVWKTVVTGFRFREDSGAGYVLEQQPIGFNDWLELDTGNSIENRGLNGLPIVQQYMVSPGAFPYPIIDSGGTV